MADNLSQYLDLFLQTGKEYLQSLNKCLIVLEKNPQDKDAIGEVFRSAHSLKSQSAAMGFASTAFLCHTVEDIFYEIKQGKLQVTPELADLLFASFDGLTNSINQIEKDHKELDLNESAENLKKLTGIQTEGIGKSVRDNTIAPVLDNSIVQPEKIVNNNETIKQSITVPTPSAIKTIAVKVTQLDAMMNLLEELLVYRLSLKTLVKQLDNEDLRDYFDKTEKIIDLLQYQLMQARAVPVKIIFDHFPRAVRDLARQENKKIELVVTGDDLELDRTIVDRLDEPLIHLIRNAVSHGIPDMPQEGDNKTYTIHLTARREKDYAVIDVSDDGLGIDWKAVAEKANLTSDDPEALKKALFSGISTSTKVTQVSGRGVGLEVVKKMVEDFGGEIDVKSVRGQGTTFSLNLPLTLAITKALLIRVGEEQYAIPTSTIDRSIKIDLTQVKKTADQEAIVLDENEVPLFRLKEFFKLSDKHSPQITNTLLLVILSLRNERMGLVVDEIIEANEFIIKPVPDVLKGNPYFAGTTILGNGQTVLIINPQGLL